MQLLSVRKTCHHFQLNVMLYYHSQAKAADAAFDFEPPKKNIDQITLNTKSTDMKLFKKRPVHLMVSSLLVSPVLFSHAAFGQDEPADQHEALERIVITANPLDRTAIESAQPVYVLAGDALRQAQAPTLGETLRDLPGVQSTYYSPTSSSPVIRGLDGPRVRVLQNGLDVGDVSRGGPDHAVSTETSTAEQIEVLRGPATLLYGSGASGGIVNVVDNRVPREQLNGTEGQVSAGVSSAANERSASAALRQGNGAWVGHLDAFKRDADDYRVPSFINPDGERSETIENSFTEDQGATLGASFIGQRGFIGASVGRLERDYGIPGHSHEDEHDNEHDDHGHDDHGHDDYGHSHDDVIASMTQDRVQLLGQLDNPWRGIDRINANLGYSELTHEELLDGFTESAFSMRQKEARITARYSELAGWGGAFGVQLKQDDYNAFGVEAFTPRSSTDLAGLFWLTERRSGNMLYEVGARVEYVELTTDAVLPLDYTPVSASAGLTYEASDMLKLNANIAYSERAPHSSELFSNGAHFATRTYEVGGIFEIHGEHGHDEGHDDHDHGHDEYHLAYRDTALDKERSANIDLGMHYDGLQWHFDANVFYNRIDDFIYASNTGILSADLDGDLGGHDDHGHEHDHEHDSSSLDVYQYTQRDTELFGYELSAHYLLNEQWKFGAFSDYTRARFRSGGNVPRTPAQRVGLDVAFAQPTWDAKLSYTYYMSQNKTADYESSTDGFGMLSAYLNFYPQLAGGQDLAFYIKAENLGNQLGYVHNSFIRDYAPMPGTNIGAGVRLRF